MPRKIRTCSHCFREITEGKTCPRCQRILNRMEFYHELAQKMDKFNMSSVSKEDDNGLSERIKKF